MTRVLYAEDDPQVADIVRLYFLPHPTTELTVVPGGRACLSELLVGNYDLVLLDLAMPDLDGLSVLAELSARSDPTPVIMVSGQGQAELAVRALRAGAADCIDKNSPNYNAECSKSEGAEISRSDACSLTSQNYTLDYVLKFANIPRPMVSTHMLECLFRQIKTFFTVNMGCMNRPGFGGGPNS